MADGLTGERIEQLADRIDRFAPKFETLDNPDPAGLALARASRELLAEVRRLLSEGSPGVMHEVDRAFYKLAIRDRELAEQRHADLLAQCHRGAALTANLGWRDFTLHGGGQHESDVMALCRYKGEPDCEENIPNQQGRYLTLGEAVDFGIRHLADHTVRELADRPVPKRHTLFDVSALAASGEALPNECQCPDEVEYGKDCRIHDPGPDACRRCGALSGLHLFHNCDGNPR
jgi:hypothetical protein